MKKKEQAGPSGWKRVTGVTCDRGVSAKTKGKVFQTIVRPTMVYGLEAMALTINAGGRVGGSRVKDAAVFNKSDEDEHD